MPSIVSAWLVGSITIPQQDFTANGFACSIAAGTYYLHHPQTGALSLALQFISEIENETGAAVGGVEFTRSRHFTMTFSPDVSVTWGTATQLRDLLGYTGNLASGATHLAPNVSPLLWSPGWPATPRTIPGVEGYSVDHKTQFKSDDGSALHTDFYSEEIWQDLEWTHIAPSRLRVATGTGGGTFHEFYEQCAKLGERFHYYESVTEDASDSSTIVTDLTAGNIKGPYVLRKFDGDWYRRRVKAADVSSPLELPLHVVDEVS